jgi:hypothetical protein
MQFCTGTQPKLSGANLIVEMERFGQVASRSLRATMHDMLTVRAPIRGVGCDVGWFLSGW